VSLIVVMIAPLSDDEMEEARAELVEEIRATLDRYKHEGNNLLLTGTTVLMHDTNRMIEKDNRIVLPLTLLVMLLLLYLIYRKISFVVLPFLITAVSVFWVIGVMGLWGKHMTAFTTLVPLVLLTIVLCDAVHILNAIWQESSEGSLGAPQKEVVMRGLRMVLLPCILASLDNMIGFFTFITSRMQAVQELGILVAVGIVFAFVLSVIIIPIVLFRSMPKKERKDAERFLYFPNRMRCIGEWSLNNTKFCISTTFLLSVLGVVGLFRMDVEQKLCGFFKEKTTMEEANALFKKREMGASGEIDILLRSAPGTFKETSMINTLLTMENEFKTVTFYRKSYSISKILQWIAGKYNDTEVTHLTQDEVVGGIGLLEIYADSSFSTTEYMNPDASEYRIKIYTLFGDSTLDVLMIEREYREILNKYLPQGVAYDIVGRPLIWAHMVHYVVDSQLQSFLWAFLTVAAIIAILFRSAKIGLIALFANLVPVLLVMGLVGWSGYPFNAFMAMVACAALGLGVDDTIHFVLYYKRCLLKGLSPREAILNGYEHVGFQMVITTLLMASGLVIFYFCHLTTTTEFGLLFAAMCIATLLAILFVFPPLLLWVKPNLR
jgi:predicted RND superfamily exporter protein